MPELAMGPATKHIHHMLATNATTTLSVLQHAWRPCTLCTVCPPQHPLDEVSQLPTMLPGPLITPAPQKT